MIGRRHRVDSGPANARQQGRARTMSQPLFSVVVPTRNRASLARESVERVLAQTCDDLEVVVLENSDRSELCGEWPDGRVRVVPSEQVLSMPDNWERGIGLLRGRYTLIISDKDMLVPTALEQLAAELGRDGARLAHYHKAVFDGERLKLRRLTGRASTQQARPVLAAWFDSVQHANAPMVYNSAVETDVIRQVQRRHGRFFVGSSPDVASGPILMAQLETYRALDRYLSVSYVGPWSIGNANLGGSAGGASKAFVSEFAENPFERANVVQNVTGSVAETLQAVKDHMPQVFSAYEVNWSRYVSVVVRELLNAQRHGGDLRSGLRELRNRADGRYGRADILRALILQRRWVRKLLREPGRVRYKRGRSFKLPIGDLQAAVAHVASFESDAIAPPKEATAS
jgi:hypothetical protein